jgi:hypothetical protein
MFAGGLDLCNAAASIIGAVANNRIQQRSERRALVGPIGLMNCGGQRRNFSTRSPTPAVIRTVKLLDHPRDGAAPLRPLTEGDPPDLIIAR